MARSAPTLWIYGGRSLFFLRSGHLTSFSVTAMSEETAGIVCRDR
jgi:hypothetical protein